MRGISAWLVISVAAAGCGEHLLPAGETTELIYVVGYLLEGPRDARRVAAFADSLA